MPKLQKKTHCADPIACFLDLPLDYCGPENTLHTKIKKLRKSPTDTSSTGAATSQTAGIKP